MKRLIAGIFSVSLILGSGTAILAAGNESPEGFLNFGKVKPLMQEMHPEFSNQELKEMFESCHGTKGAMPSSVFKQMAKDKMEDIMY
ncbi:hypothetical protein J7I93_17590 [Bacillus sp. ISL-47]|uniref:hypothetical protein n=1 Tax=Bacillus sp. ISL-47 TaxID=2819130 RepID=UPI001BE5C480|nr:hypothetical protein [Bacillus sp. ISL-47]MBT2689983.1 hypothetical protein [Bacillus sp. ISL-47]MBT2709350.1 hypothetical protein [Pseudomonas sp. ISL-84]